ncbi:nucleoside deaminase [Hyalangium rubrum]|uniref:Nucleoside deaminase n=1 Tax=Hyalangium rubrum TaxID=3103134 RepID=A0ABU5HI71_9BACT|nr:nucleoside deaminase [Hyalangium sp. s54d21]MDY7233051.1 nucleoside deaminase [Hyalangium sp. s54d21]
MTGSRMNTRDRTYLERAVELALQSERAGNLPVGALLVLDGSIISEGASSVLQPVYDPGAHAEMCALRGVDKALWPRAREMTCYSTLEPCVMCMGALLLHGVGRVVFGATDVEGGAGGLLPHLPPYYAGTNAMEWVGPLLPEVCDPLYRRTDEAFAKLPCGRDALRSRDS